MLEEAENIIKQFLPTLEEVFKTEDINVVVEENKGKIIPETGVGGFCPDSYTVNIYIDPDSSNLKFNLKKEIKSTLAHEFHHAIRNRFINWRDDTLLGAMVTEGLADHFDLEINQGEIKPWSKAIGEAELRRLFDKAKIEFDSRSYSYNDWFFGNSDLEIPKWVGYSMGFKIVGDYLKKTRKRASELVSSPADLFV